VRTTRGLKLTQTGRTLSLTLQQAFESIGDAVNAVSPAKPRRDRKAVALTTVPSFAARWLAPRLPRFIATHPDIDVRINCSPDIRAFARGKVDVAVRYGRGRWPNLFVQTLFPPVLSPVCAPALAARGRGLRNPADLRGATLIHDTHYGPWEAWLKQARVEGVDARSGFLFDDFNVIIQAAMEGLGVALVPEPLTMGDLAAGRLMKPFARTLAVDVSYYAVCPKAHLEDAATAAFVDWMVAEAAQPSA
jgi:LysR family glycine cleavage system transcriptional activator